MAADRAEEWVLYEVVERHVAQITLNRPSRRNAIAVPAMNDDLTAAIRTAEEDDDIKVIILTGAGTDFCSGEDVRQTPVEAAGLKKGSRLPQSVRMRSITRNLEGDFLLSDKTVIAAVRGAALGMGFKLALESDLIIAADDAKFGRPASRIGLAGFDTFLPVVLLRLGINRGYEALITGRTIPAEELASWGVVSSVVPVDNLHDEALRYARAVANHSTDGLMLGRKALQMFWSMLGMAQWNAFAQVAHPLFTNLVWRDDESNFLKERKAADNASTALKEVYRRWEDLGFG
jgi:enoyl-CoA hydratase